jgi:oxygen-dependent protoporphyrinogen oxidase
MARVGIIGAGIAGLTAAYQLHQQGADIQVLEATDRPGGVIRSDDRDGFLVEAGPNTIRPSPLLERVIESLDLAAERVWANDEARRRYVVRDGRPVPIPMSVAGFLRTDLFSTRAKLRLLAEPFIGSSEEDDESLAAFTRRRLGPEVLDYAVAPFVGGVFAGDPERLSARHAFEKLVTLEEEHGSLFWGAVRSHDNEDDDTPSGLYSFRDGAETLPRALASALGDRVTYNAPDTRLSRTDTVWTAHVDVPGRTAAAPSFDALLCTVPLHALDDLAVETPVDRTPLHKVEYPPVHVVALGYDRADVTHPLDGFGMLVPPVEERFDILGTLFSSTLFPGRAPDDTALLTTFVGGARDPALARRSEETLQSIVERDLARLLGVDGTPTFVHHVHWPRAIPQYTPGYGAVKDTLAALEAEHPALFLAGNYRQGVSVGDAAASGDAAANRIQDAL